MKKILLLILLIGCAGKLFAQKIHFTDTTNIWKEVQPVYNAPAPWLFHYYTHSFVSDTLIDSVKYSLFSFGMVREDTVLNKVYIRGDSEVVLMDYNLNAGDPFTAGNNRYVVEKKDSTLINGIWHKVWYFPPPAAGIYGADSIIVIEGIGCIQDPTYMFWDFTGCVECSEPLMYCFSNDSITPALLPPAGWLDNSTSCTTLATLHTTELEINGETRNIYPNPATASLTISSPNKITSIIITNLLGQTICTNSYPNEEQVQINVADLPAGVYFVQVNGTEVRKFIKE